MGHDDENEDKEWAAEEAERKARDELAAKLKENLAVDIHGAFKHALAAQDVLGGTLQNGPGTIQEDIDLGKALAYNNIGITVLSAIYAALVEGMDSDSLGRVATRVIVDD